MRERKMEIGRKRKRECEKGNCGKEWEEDSESTRQKRYIVEAQRNRGGGNLEKGRRKSVIENALYRCEARRKLQMLFICDSK